MENTAVPKIDRRIRRTKNLIKMTLLTLMTEKKTSRITVSELTEAADINRKTFYNHYSDIGSVLTDLENELSDKILRYIPGKEFGHIFERPELVIGAIMAELENNLELYRLLVESGVHIQLFQQLKNKLIDSILASDWREFYEANPSMELFLDFICNGFFAAVQNQCRADRKMSTEDFCSMMTLQFSKANEAYRQFSGFPGIAESEADNAKSPQTAKRA